MSIGKDSSMEAPALGLQAVSGLGWFGHVIGARFLCWMNRFRERWAPLGRLQRKDGFQSKQHLHDEATFRFLVANEVKRSERSGQPVYVLLVSMGGSEDLCAPIGSERISSLLSILSAVLRETDYVGWFRNGHVLGGVLTAWGEYSSKQSLSQIEQRFWDRVKHEFPTKDCTRLSVHLCELQELSRLESGSEG